MLQQGGELIGMAGEELSSGGEAATTSALLASVSSGDSSSSQMVSETPQLIKSSLGQFVVLQQNQVRVQLFLQWCCSMEFTPALLSLCLFTGVCPFFHCA